MGVKNSHVTLFFWSPIPSFIYKNLMLIFFPVAEAFSGDSNMSPALRILLFSLLVASFSFISNAQLEEWCIADEQMPDGELQSALDWACGAGGADCKQIQVNQPCYLPNTLKDHASYAFNSYYQKFKNKGAYCYFNSAAMITGRDPSHGGCKYEYTP